MEPPQPKHRSDGQRRDRRRRRTTLTVIVAALLGSVVLVVTLARSDVRDAFMYELKQKEPVPTVLGPAAVPADASAEDVAIVSDRAQPSAGSAPGPSTTASPIRLAAAGDVGTGGDEEFATAVAMDDLEGQAEYAALLLLGDNVYEDGDPARASHAVFAPFADVLDNGTRLLPVLGNHDNDSGFGDAQSEALGMPARWYSTLIGNVLVVSLDSTQPENPEQLAWLTAELARSPATWTIVELHHPPYSGGYHGSSVAVREAFGPLFQQYGVQLVLAGHDHDYQRSEVIDGVTYIVSGAAARLRDAHRADFTAVAFSTYHFLDITVWPDRIDVQAVDQRGDVLDAVSITGAHQPDGGDPV